MDGTAGMQRRRVMAIAGAALLATVAGPVPAPAAAGRAVVVASKIDTEGALLGNMILLVLARHGVPVENRLQLGPTNIVRAALLAGQIDIYPEYTGNGALFFHREGDPVWKDRMQGWEAVEALDRAKNGVVWLDPAPANNTWVIAVRRDLATRAHLRTMSDFARYVRRGGRIYLAASAEFVESPSALPAFEKTYGFRLDDGQLLTLSGGNTAATLRAAAEGMSGVNAAMAYGTDGAIAALGLVALDDDKGAEIVYAPAPVVRHSILAQYPQIPRLLDPVFHSLSLEALQRLNARIAVDGEEAAAVARDYLEQRGFLS
jgi:osmoprotectant transport system substrate-binding protein